MLSPVASPESLTLSTFDLLKLFKEADWDKYRIPSTTKGVDSIIECTLSDNPDFGDPDALTAQIESGTLNLIGDIEDFLSGH